MVWILSRYIISSKIQSRGCVIFSPPCDTAAVVVSAVSCTVVEQIVSHRTTGEAHSSTGPQNPQKVLAYILLRCCSCLVIILIETTRNSPPLHDVRTNSMRKKLDAITRLRPPTTTCCHTTVQHRACREHSRAHHSARHEHDTSRVDPYVLGRIDPYSDE